MQKITVREVQFDSIETNAHGTRGRVDKRRTYPRHIVLGHGARHMPAGTKRDR